MMRSTTPLYSTSPHCPTLRAELLDGRAFVLLKSHFRPISAIGYLHGDGIMAFHSSLQLDKYKRPPSLHIQAAAKKPPPKPASRGVIIGAILLPIAMAGSAVITGRIMLARIKKEAMEEAEEWDRKFNPSRLLPDGKTEEERKLERERIASTGNADLPSTRSRPKRED
ncbi:hypothetical protein L7F22_050329 [Adiantum nelumboides]|nr:hypothetical protein [Adiantum nelumboides]